MTDIKLALDQIIAKREGYNMAEAYYEGVNQEVFAHQRWFRLFRNERSNFRFNFSKTARRGVGGTLIITNYIFMPSFP